MTAGSRARSTVRAAFVPIGSMLLLAFMVGLVLATARDTLGYDYRCYDSAVRALLDGKPLYDNAFSINVGTCPGTYTYPPPFAAALIPWLALGGAAALAWSLLMAASLVVGIAILPVRRDVRWVLVILAALDWPFLYSVKLGQVGPLLFLLFAIAWRWMERPAAAGAAIAAGALVKVQPGLLLLWAVATRRYRIAASALALGVALAVVSLLVTGLAAWRDYADLVGGLNAALRAEHNVAVGAIAQQAGLSASDASALQLISAVIAIVAVLAAWRWLSPVASFQATVVVSQLVASPLRDHYAVVLLLPTAWLLARGRMWAVAIPLAGWLSLASRSSWLSGLTVPLSFFVCLVAVLLEGVRERRVATSVATPSAVASVETGSHAILRP